MNYYANDKIRDAQVRLIDENGNQLGIMSTFDAKKIAIERGFDLVKINSDSKPSICKLLDLSKFKYEQKKKDKINKKNQKNIVIKEIRLSLSIDNHDIEVKVNKAREFLISGFKVKLSLKFRGRELNRVSRSSGVIDKFIDALKEVSIVEKKPMFENRMIFIILSPKNN